MTREQLATVKENAERATKIVALIERLETAKKANLALAVKNLTCWNSGNELLPHDLYLRVVKLGIDTLITQLEAELAGIPVTAAEVKPVPAPSYLANAHYAVEGGELVGYDDPIPLNEAARKVAAPADVRHDTLPDTFVASYDSDYRSVTMPTVGTIRAQFSPATPLKPRDFSQELDDLAGETCFTVPAKLAEVEG